jgi:flagellar protein FliT
MNISDKNPGNATGQPTACQVVMNYESLSAITGQMRDAAAQGEWDQLAGLEQLCNQHVASMKSVDALASLDEPSRQRKIQLIRKILADDAEIRNRTEVWMGQLQRIMQNSRHEQRLQQTYGV